MGRMASEISDVNPAAVKVLNEAFGVWISEVKGWLREAEGRFPEGTNLAKLAMFVLVTMEGAVMLARSVRRIEPYDESVAELRRYFELLGDKTRRTQGKRGGEK